MQDKVFVEATYEVVAKIKGHKLADKQTVMVPVDISKLNGVYKAATFRTLFFALVETAACNEAAKAFVQRLKTETALKRKIGGTQWSIQLVRGVEAQPLYLKEAKIGDFKQFIKSRKVSDWDEEKKVRTTKIIYPDIMGQIVDRNMAIVKILYDQPIGVAANEDVERKVA